MNRQCYRIRVAKDYLSFCAGHFISLEGSPCERLHGHNYRLAVEVEAELAAGGLVFDFAELKGIVRRITDELDHRMLLPIGNDEISVETKGDQVYAEMKGQRWSFPFSHCVFLPIKNTTAELIAKWLTERVQAELQKRGGIVPTVIRLEVEESPGQSAAYEVYRDR